MGIAIVVGCLTPVFMGGIIRDGGMPYQHIVPSRMVSGKIASSDCHAYVER